MTLPRSKAFSCSRGFQAQADVGVNSPQTTTSQNVNIVVQPALTRDVPIQTRDAKLFKVGEDQNPEQPKEIDEVPLNDCLERNLEDAIVKQTEIEAIVKSKENLIEALSIMLDLHENNPVWLGKNIIPNEEELTRLIFLLTSADQIEIIKADPETTCCKIEQFTFIQKIMIKKDDHTYNFKYSFPNALRLLETRKISWKIIRN